MKKFGLYLRLGIDEKVEEASRKLEQDLKKLREGQGRVKAEAEKLNDDIWTKHETWRRAQVLGLDNVAGLSEDLQNVMGRKREIVANHQRTISEKRVLMEKMMEPIWADAIKLFDETSSKIMEGYIYRVTVSRPHPFNPNQMLPGYRTNINSGEKTIDVFSNAQAVNEAKTILTKAKARIRDCLSVPTLHQLLDEIDTSLNKINFDEKMVTVPLHDHETMKWDSSKPEQVIFLFQDKNLNLQARK